MTHEKISICGHVLITKVLCFHSESSQLLFSMQIDLKDSYHNFAVIMCASDPVNSLCHVVFSNITTNARLVLVPNR